MSEPITVPSYEEVDLGGGYKLAHRAMHTEKPCAACEIVRLRSELSTLQAALEQATKERDEAK